METRLPAPSAPATGAQIVQALHSVTDLASVVIPHLPSLSDEDVLAVRDTALQIEGEAWQVVVACHAEIHDRIWERSRRSGTSVEEALQREAARLGVSTRTLRLDRQIQQTFFKDGRSPAASACSEQPVKLDKNFYEIAVSAPDPHAAIAHVAQRKLENPSFTVRDAYREVRELFDRGTAESTDWYTPRHVLDLVVALFGAIDLDPCSNSHERPNVPASEHYTIDDDGLRLPWWGRCFVNPPYNGLTDAWVERTVTAYGSREIEAAVLLIPAYTDTGWFRLLWEYDVCFLHGRLTFLDRHGKSDNTARFPSAIAYLGQDRRSFRRLFRTVGTVVHRVPTED